jgi:hypothetical protein
VVIVRTLTFLLCVILSATASRAAHRDASPFGINGCTWSHLGANTGKFDREAGLKRLAALKESGARWDRFDLWWGRVEPEPDTFGWDDYDWVFARYREAGIEVMPILCYASAWSPNNAAPVTDVERERYARYVFEAVSRYKKTVHTWEIWNEPNILPFWSPRPHAPDYAALLKLAYAAAKKADPKCTVVGVATAGTDLPFIEDVLRLGGGDHFDVLSIHPYQGDLGSLSPDAGGLFEQIHAVRALLGKYDHADKPIHLTEIGHRTTGTHGHTSVTEEQQAAYLVRTYVLALAAGVDRVFWFNLQDWDEYWGIIRQNYDRKPSFDAYRTMVKHLDGKICVGQVDGWQGVTAYAFAPRGQKPTRQNIVLVAWRPDEGQSRLRMKMADADVGMMPIFRTNLHRTSDFSMTWLKPLPTTSHAPATMPAP